MKREAVFLDRDGTIIEDSGYVDNPDKVKLIPRAAEAIRKLNKAGYLIVIASNQSGVARGLFDEATLSAVHHRMEELLHKEGATIDGAYYCPFLAGGEAVVEKYRRESDLRKPRPGLLLQAGQEMHIDMRASWMIGDAPRDVEAGKAAGCRTVLIDPREQHTDDKSQPTHRADNLLQAADFVLEAEPPIETPQEPETRLSTGAIAPIEEQLIATPTEKPNSGATESAKSDESSDEEKKQTATKSPSSLDDIRDRLDIALPRIEKQLDRIYRRGRQDDFSIVRLFGALLQMFAIAAAIWGALTIASGPADQASARLLLAIFLQIAALVTLVMDRLK